MHCPPFAHGFGVQSSVSIMKRNDELFIYTTLLHYNHNISTNDSYEMCNSISVNVKLPVWNTCNFSIYLCLAYAGFKQTQVSMQRWQSILESFSKQQDWNVIIHQHTYWIGVFVIHKTPSLATSDFIISYRIHNVVRMLQKHNNRKNGTENINNILRCNDTSVSFGTGTRESIN